MVEVKNKLFAFPQRFDALVVTARGDGVGGDGIPFFSDYTFTARDCGCGDMVNHQLVPVYDDRWSPTRILLGHADVWSEPLAYDHDGLCGAYPQLFGKNVDFGIFGVPVGSVGTMIIRATGCRLQGRVSTWASGYGPSDAPSVTYIAITGPGLFEIAAPADDVWGFVEFPQ